LRYKIELEDHGDFNGGGDQEFDAEEDFI